MKTVSRFSLALAAVVLLKPALFAQTDGLPGPTRETSVSLVGSTPTQEPGSFGDVSPGTAKPLMETGDGGTMPSQTPCTSGSIMPFDEHMPPPCESSAPAKTDRFGVWGDFLYMRARNTDTIFGQPRDGSTILSAPLGAQGILQPDYAAGFRFGMSYALTPCSSIEASFSWWEDETHAFLGVPGNPPGALIQSNITLPGIQNSAADSLSAKASQAIELRTADVDYKHIMCGEPGCYTVNWLVGAYFAYQRQDMHGEFSILGTTEVDSKLTFEGAGPQVGVDGELLGPWGLRLYGKSTANLLAGHYGGSYNQFNVFAGNQGNIDYKSDRIVPILDLELGIGWASKDGHFRASAGYYIAAWFNSVTTPDFVNAVQANNFTTNPGNLSSDMTFDALTFRFEIRF